MSMKALKAQAKTGAASRLSRMGRFAKGGKVVDGDADDKQMPKAKKPPASIMVDGKAARPRLDRPGRRMKRAEGGWTGEGDSGKALKEKAADEHATGLAEGSKGILSAGLGPAVAIGSMGPGKGRLVAKVLGTLAGAGGAGKLAQGYSHELESKRLSREGDTAEGRKRGGVAK